MNNLRSILYISSAVHPPSYEQMRHLLHKARERNAINDITGILLLVDSNFMQYIEGPEQNLNNIYQIIKNDTLHKGIIEIFNEPIRSRLCSNWNMAFDSTDFKGFTDPDQYHSILHPNLIKADVDSADIYGLLNNFWNSHRSFT